MNQPATRLVVYPKDVRNITGRGYRSSRLLLAIRKAFGRSPEAWVTMEEFCRYTGWGRRKMSDEW